MSKIVHFEIPVDDSQQAATFHSDIHRTPVLIAIVEDLTQWGCSIRTYTAFEG